MNHGLHTSIIALATNAVIIGHNVVVSIIVGR